MLFIEMMTLMKKSVSQIIQEVRDFANFHYCIVEDTISYVAESKINEYLENYTPDFPENPIEVRRFGKNVKYIFENDEWAILRLSGTEPVLRVFVETQNEKKTYQYLNIIKDYISNMEREKINV